MDGLVSSPSPGLLITPLFLLHPASECEEWTDAEVVVISESSGKRSVSFRGPGLMAKDWSIFRTPSGNTVATWTLFVPLTEGLWTAVELFKSSVLAEAKMEENMLQD